MANGFRTVIGLAALTLVTSCGEWKFPPPAIVQVPATPAPVVSPPEPLIFESSIGKGVCVTVQLNQGIPTGFICGVLAEARPDGILISNVDRKNVYGVDPGLNAILPITVVKVVSVRP